MPQPPPRPPNHPRFRECKEHESWEFEDYDQGSGTTWFIAKYMDPGGNDLFAADNCANCALAGWLKELTRRRRAYADLECGAEFAKAERLVGRVHEAERAIDEWLEWIGSD